MERRLDSRHRLPFIVLALVARNLAAAHAQIYEQQHQILVWRGAAIEWRSAGGGLAMSGHCRRATAQRGIVEGRLAQRAVAAMRGQRARAMHTAPVQVTIVTEGVLHRPVPFLYALCCSFRS